MPSDFPDNAAIAQILHRLNSPDAGVAWSEFVDHFSPLVMQAVSQFEFEHERVNDCYLQVLEKLSDNGFRRLLKFDTRGKAKFSTWLAAVVYNLCVDWHRREFGRARMLPSINVLPALERSIFHLYFNQAMDREACFQTLGDEFPDLDRQKFTEAITRVFRILTPRQRWQLTLRHRRKLMLRGVSESTELLAADAPNPDAQAESGESRARLKSVMNALDPQQRLLLNLRYVEGITLSKIADLLQLGDPFRARRLIDKALDAAYLKMRAGSGEDY